MSTKRIPEPRLPYGAYTAIARRMKELGLKPNSPSGVWRAIHQYRTPEVLTIAAEYIEQLEKKKNQARTRLSHALNQ